MKKILFALMFVAFACLALCGFNVSTAATTSNEIYIEGAQVRVEGTAGIRFVGKISDSFDAEEVTAYGFALAFGETDIDNIVIGGTVNGKSVLCTQVSDTTEEGNYYVNLIDIPDNMYGQKVTARTYFVKNGEVIYSDSTTVRSLGQVTLAVKNAGQTSELIESVFDVLSTKYMKAYPYGEYYYINNAVYEYEPTVLADYFIEDYNKVMGTNLTTMVGFAKSNMGAWPSDTTTGAGTNTEIQENNLYKFYNANNGEMLTKWGWVLDYLSDLVGNDTSNSGKDFVPVQVNYINGTTALADSNEGWWGCRHLISRIEGFFTRTKVTSTGFYSTEFVTNSEYTGLVSLIDSLDVSSKYLANGNANLVYVGNKISTDVVEKEGYTLTSYTIDSTEYQIGSDYVVTTTPVVITPNFTPIQYNITYMNGDEEITDLADTYTIEDEVTLPTKYNLGDVDVHAWYESSSLDGEAITTIPVGTIGNKVYYAKTGELLLKNVSIEYDLNGGTFMKYNSVDAAIADYIKDYNAYGSYSYTADTYYELGAWTIGKQVSFFLTSSTYGAKWSWLVDFIAKNGSDKNKEAFEVLYEYITDGDSTTDYNAYNAADGNYQYMLCYELRAWAGKSQYSQNTNYVTSNYSNAAIQKELLDNYVRGQVDYTYSDPCTLKTPTMDGASFVGWVSSVDGSITKQFPGYYINPGKVTYTAKWAYDGIMIGNTTYSSLSAAVSAAKAGDTINVPAGTYTTDFTISANNVSIKGANAWVAGDGNRGSETILSGTITVSGASGVTVEGCKFTDYSQVLLTSGTSDFTFENNVIEILASSSYDGIVCLSDTTGTVTNVKINNNYSSDYKSGRFARFAGIVAGLEMTGNKIYGNINNGSYRCYDFLNVAYIKGDVNISDNVFTNAAQSFIYAKKVGVMNCVIKNNDISNVTNTAIDFRDMQENGAVSFVIENNKFENIAINGWGPIRVRSASYDSNDSLSVIVNDNKFIDAYVVVSSAYRFINNPSYSDGTGAFDKIYTIGRNYYEIDGVAFTSLTAANFGNAAISFGEAYATEAEVPGF